ncbi:hypothetical protein [Kitasatospora sp. NPDC057015]|uniref:hypothetical protein n=1 Tax=Kitasatospora sp. NPDC057015 TaxID=3346001 RepID=UPI00363C9B63
MSMPQGCGIGCLVVIVGVIAGFMADASATDTIVDSRAYCANLAWPVLFDLESYTPRLDGLDGMPYMLAYFSCVPLGFTLAWWGLRRRALWARTTVGCLAGLLLLGTAIAGDLSLNIASEPGYYTSARCPAGHPPWWPHWLPIRDSGMTPKREDPT